MIPLVDYEQELEIMRALVVAIGDEEGLSVGTDYTVGTMIELPRAVLRGQPHRRARRLLLLRDQRPHPDGARLLARRRRVEVLVRYLERKIVDRSPFETIDQPGVGWLVRLAAWVGREAKPDLKLGICGEHGGDPESIDFFHMAGLDYVSCSPFRVPIAGGRGAGDHRARGLCRLCETTLAPRRNGRAAASGGDAARVELRRRRYPSSAGGGPEEECTCARRSSATATDSVHCKAFRRLKHKTQVVRRAGGGITTAPAHRTRTKPTQISATVARAALNEDLDWRRSAWGTTSGTRRSGTSARDVPRRCGRASASAAASATTSTRCGSSTCSRT
jgi:hypothetical protein